MVDHFLVTRALISIPVSSGESAASTGACRAAGSGGHIVLRPSGRCSAGRGDGQPVQQQPVGCLGRARRLARRPRPPAITHASDAAQPVGTGRQQHGSTDWRPMRRAQPTGSTGGRSTLSPGSAAACRLPRSASPPLPLPPVPHVEFAAGIHPTTRQQPSLPQQQQSQQQQQQQQQWRPSARAAWAATSSASPSACRSRPP